MNYPSISIDTYDLVIITALIGGFWTSEWIPFTLFLIWELIKQWIEFEALKESPTLKTEGETLIP